jgi:hypothetical protein
VAENTLAEFVVMATRALTEADWARVPQKTDGRKKSGNGRQNSSHNDSSVNGGVEKSHISKVVLVVLGRSAWRNRLGIGCIPVSGMSSRY